MRLLTLFLLSYFFSGCNVTKNFYNRGSIQSDTPSDELDITFINDLPFCNVEINKNRYRFLIDTGAPTVISEEIFKNLKNDVHHTGTVKDSQGQVNSEKFTIIPRIKIGNIVFNEIGSVVLDLNNSELKCFEYDGIIGANILSKMYCEFDYQNKKILLSNKIMSSNIKKFDFSLSYYQSPQKTPLIKGNILGEKLLFTFDTGYNGNIEYKTSLEIIENKFPINHFITNGINSVGLYGRGLQKKEILFKSNFYLNKLLLENEIIESGNASLIGNEFLKKYAFLIDWKKQKIYFKKKIVNKENGLRGFGIKYLFENKKAFVVAKVENKDIPLELGDQIIKINEFDFTGLSDNEICNYLLNKVEKDKEFITVTIKRREATHSFNIKKLQLIL
jgi:predicted aspartyl protease